MDDPAGRQIDHVHGVVAKLSNDQAVAREIDRHVIDAPCNPGKRNGPFQYQRRCRVGRLGRERQVTRDQEGQHYSDRNRHRGT